MATPSIDCPTCGTRIHVDEACPKCCAKPFAPAPGSEAGASDSRIAKPKEQWCLKGHSAICDNLCKLWCCKFEHQEALLAKPLNDQAHA